MEIDLAEWDKRIGPRLNDIEYSGNAIARHARYIQDRTTTLPARPAWESKAREVLNEAEIELRMALAVIQVAQKEYDNLPVLS